jgi:hypothetical protein
MIRPIPVVESTVLYTDDSKGFMVISAVNPGFAALT